MPPAVNRRHPHCGRGTASEPPRLGQRHRRGEAAPLHRIAAADWPLAATAKDSAAVAAAVPSISGRAVAATAMQLEPNELGTNELGSVLRSEKLRVQQELANGALPTDGDAPRTAKGRMNIARGPVIKNSQ